MITAFIYIIVGVFVIGALIIVIRERIAEKKKENPDDYKKY